MRLGDPSRVTATQVLFCIVLASDRGLCSHPKHTSWTNRRKLSLLNIQQNFRKWIKGEKAALIHMRALEKPNGLVLKTEGRNVLRTMMLHIIGLPFYSRHCHQASASHCSFRDISTTQAVCNTTNNFVNSCLTSQFHVVPWIRKNCTFLHAPYTLSRHVA